MAIESTENNSRTEFGNCGTEWSTLAAMMLLGCIALSSAVRAQDEAWRSKLPVSTGVAVRQKIPAFSGTDQNGQVRNFDSIKGPGGAMIVFSRSVDW
jgi:hypothetical protein